MKIITDSIEFEIDSEEIRHFGFESAQDVRDFIDTVRIQGKNIPGFQIKEED